MMALHESLLKIFQNVANTSCLCTTVYGDQGIEYERTGETYDSTLQIKISNISPYVMKLLDTN